jgi:hypothetical protein
VPEIEPNFVDRKCIEDDSDKLQQAEKPKLQLHSLLLSHQMQVAQ